MKVTFSAISIPRSGALAVTVMDGRKLSPTAEKIDKAMGGGLRRAIKAGRFKGQYGQVLEIAAPSGTSLSLLIAIGLGKPKGVDALKIQNLGGTLVRRFNAAGVTKAAIAIDGLKGGTETPAKTAAFVGFGANLGSYRFDRYRTTQKPEKKPTLATLTIMSNRSAEAKRAYTPMSKTAAGVFVTRDLVSEPANILFPKSLAAQARKLSKLGVKVEVLGRAKMKQLGMGALLGVAQGSVHEPQLVIMRWNGLPKNKMRAPIALVGKGVTFDSGGISIKPSGGMEDMKWDMGGSGVVIGTIHALAARKAKVNVVGVVGLVENMPSGTAQRPGDIVKSMSGQTIEVLNTDAEGRLVLADALWYTQERFKPELMIDLATLTGAVIVALGDLHAGIFSNNDKLAERVTQAGLDVGERVWRMPLLPDYDKALDCDIADMKNIGSRAAGSITAAQFLQRFVNKVPWIHIDIAGVTWSGKDKPTVPKGGTGFGVRLLNRLIAIHYEK
jgi:leucyl aminopeptidase